MAHRLRVGLLGTVAVCLLLLATGLLHVRRWENTYEIWLARSEHICEDGITFAFSRDFSQFGLTVKTGPTKRDYFHCGSLLY